MKARKNLTRYAVLAVLAIGAAFLLWQSFGAGTSGDANASGVTVPTFSPLAAKGQIAFDSVCAACHGANAGGTNQGPPLLNDIYNPGHHGDDAFYRAIGQGTVQHHWRFGNMPPQTQISQSTAAAIIRYIRELQQANGITYRPHRM